jgi:hypothetical protein
MPANVASVDMVECVSINTAARLTETAQVRRETATMLARIREDWPDAESRPSLIIGV